MTLKLSSIIKLALVGVFAISLGTGLSSCKKGEDKTAESADSSAVAAQSAEDAAKNAADEAEQSANKAKEAAAEVLKQLPEKAKNFLSEYEIIGMEIKEISEKILNKDADVTLQSKLKNKVLEATKKQGEAILQSKTWGMTAEQKEIYDKKFEEIRAIVESAAKAVNTGN